MAENEPTSKVENLEIPILFRIPSGKPSVYANHFFVQETADEIILSFYEVQQPIIMDENRQQVLDDLKISGVIAECVSRVIVAKHKLPDFVKPMQEIAEKVKSKLENASNRQDNQEVT